MLNLRTGGFWRFDLDDVKTAVVYSRGGGGEIQVLVITMMSRMHDTNGLLMS